MRSGHRPAHPHTSHAPPGRAATGKGASKLRRCARNLRRTAHLPGAPPPPPVPLSPPDARATLVPRRAAALSSHKRAHCRVRIGASYVPQWEDRRTLRAPSSACYAPSSVDVRVWSAQLMCILTPALPMTPFWAHLKRGQSIVVRQRLYAHSSPAITKKHDGAHQLCSAFESGPATALEFGPF